MRPIKKQLVRWEQDFIVEKDKVWGLTLPEVDANLYDIEIFENISWNTRGIWEAFLRDETS